MTLDTIIRAGMSRPARTVRALVLMGGGARTAYQVGVLRAVAAMLRLRQDGHQSRFPFQVLVGTSAGALNAAFLASTATHGLDAMDELAQFWGSLRSHSIYQLHVPRWARFSRLLSALQLWRQARRQGAILDTMPLVNTLHRVISLEGIDRALETGALEAVAITASSYTTGVHWTFCHTSADAGHVAWVRPGRRAEFQPLTIEHLMASSAIPFLFPSTPLWVDGRREYFGDGSMRQVSPLSPAVHLNASHVLVVGVGQPERSGLSGGPLAGEPGMGAVAGHALGSVFHDTLQADVEQAVRITQTLQQLPREVAAVLPYRPVNVIAIQPSQSLDALALSCVSTMPRDVRRAFGGLSAMRGGGPLASYLLFEPGFVQALIALGEEDAYARKADLMAFFE
ncbi:MAG TPA: patatin-like phospholipase family protein [Ramlibacter sp.]|nr:patatin-like phospholipase family protein [Ramlibacter sp.]